MRLLTYCYERVSSKDQVLTGKGLNDQRSQIIQFLDENAEKFSDNRTFITDEGVSAFKDSNISPESNLGKFLQDIRDHKIGEGCALVVPSLDRLSLRSSWAERTIQFIVNSGVVVFDISTRTAFSRDDPMTKILMEITQQRSHNESLMKSIRAKEAWERKIKEAVEKGEVISNKLPRWLTANNKKYVVLDKVANEIQMAFDLYISGMTTGEIVRKLDNGWRLVTVSKLLRDRRLIGEHTRSSGETIHSVFPVIIEADKFNIVQNMLDANQPSTLRKARDLLSDHDDVIEIFKLSDEGFTVGQIVRRIKNDWSTVNVLRVLRDPLVVEREIIESPRV